MNLNIFFKLGRTGRSNNKGTSYTFFTPTNGGKVDELINILNETNQYINPELYQMKKYNHKGGNNRRGGGGNRFGNKSGGYGNKSGGYGQSYNKGASGSGYGRANYENGSSGFKSGGFNNGATSGTRSHTRFDDRSGGYSNGGGSRFQ